MELTKEELDARLERFCRTMSIAHEAWDTAVILSKVSQYYFTGTMQDGLLIIKSDGQAYYFVRRSFERAMDESPVGYIYPMNSYRDAAAVAGESLGNTFVEKEIMTLAHFERLSKSFQIKTVSALDKTLLTVRSVKSQYELYWMQKSGEAHRTFLEKIVPSLLEEGISEAELAGRLFSSMVTHGHQGISRFQMFQTEMVVGQVAFGTNSLYPTSFDGPGGAVGISPAVPLLGSRERRLKKGDLVFVDIGFGINGYHSDKTQVYSFGVFPSDEAVSAHKKCIEIQSELASLLKPGVIASDIYNAVFGGLDKSFIRNFMGYEKRQARFLGHGIGLHVDEWPVISQGCSDALAENMTLALEPKKGMPGVGMVGVEDTYIVTPSGGRCLTGGGREIIVVGA